MSSKTEALQDLVNDPVSRRQFAKRTMYGTFAAAGAVALGSSAEIFAQTVTDAAVLNFALNLEYLEAEFYTVATTGRRISDIGIGVSGRGRSGATTGGSKVSLDARTQFVADQVALDEQKHVEFLRAALRDAAVAKPAINLEALGLGFRTQQEFIALARAFEDLGVSAYGGAAKLISDRNVLEAAARIALTEGQHAGLFRYLVAVANQPVPLVDDQDIPPIGTPRGRLFQVDGNGLSTVRSASAVLRIVYGGGTSRGGFFPEGVNGDIERV